MSDTSRHVTHIQSHITHIQSHVTRIQSYHTHQIMFDMPHTHQVMSQTSKSCPRPQSHVPDMKVMSHTQSHVTHITSCHTYKVMSHVSSHMTRYGGRVKEGGRVKSDLHREYIHTFTCTNTYIRTLPRASDAVRSLLTHIMTYGTHTKSCHTPQGMSHTQSHVTHIKSRPRHHVMSHTYKAVSHVSSHCQTSQVKEQVKSIDIVSGQDS